MIVERYIGDIIRELRCSRGMTQELLAEHLNLTAQAISKWENHYGFPDISQLVPLARFFGVSTDFLLGIDDAADVDELQKKIEYAISLEHYKDEYESLKELLSEYPGNLRVLSELLSCGVCILSDGDTVHQSKRKEIILECERAGKLIITYADDAQSKINAIEWMIKLYCETGDTAQALLLSENLPSRVGFNKEAAFARIYENEKKYLQAAESYEKNITQFIRQFVHSMILCANMYAHASEDQKAIEMYEETAVLCERFLECKHIEKHRLIKEYLVQSMERCMKSANYL